MFTNLPKKEDVHTLHLSIYIVILRCRKIKRHAGTPFVYRQCNTLTIEPKAAGKTSVTVKESNGGKTVTINITVLATSITASPTSITANVRDGNQKVTLGGTSILIVVGVLLETYKQIESSVASRAYKR